MTLRVAFQGAPGAYSEDAIAALWGDAATSVPAHTFGDVTRAVVVGAVDAAVIPVENSLVGPVTAALDAIAEAPSLRSIGEVVVPIHHCLLAPPGSSLGTLERAESHPLALAQCRTFFSRHPGITPVEAFDTAGAAAQVAERGDRRHGAIAGRRAAERYGLQVLLEGVEDDPENCTRFVAVAR